MIRLIEIPLALFLIYLAYLFLFPTYKIGEKEIPYNKYYTLLRELLGIFSVYLNEGNMLGIQQILEEVLESDVRLDYILHIPFKIINAENETKHCVIGILYDIGGSDPKSVKVIGEAPLRTMKRRNWREKTVIVNASPGCFNLSLSFPADLNLSCLRVFFRKKYELRIGWNNTLIVCTPFELRNDDIRVVYCVGSTIAKSHLEDVSPNVTANYSEILDSESNITEIYFEADILPGENEFMLSFGGGSVPEYQNSTLIPNCTLPKVVPKYEFIPPSNKEVSGNRVAVPVTFLYGLAMLYVTIP